MLSSRHSEARHELLTGQHPGWRPLQRWAVHRGNKAVRRDSKAVHSDGKAVHSMAALWIMRVAPFLNNAAVRRADVLAGLLAEHHMQQALPLSQNWVVRCIDC